MQQASTRRMKSIAEVVAADLCVGCGLCEAMTGGQVSMMMTPQGSLQPTPADGFDPLVEHEILSACPGIIAEARPTPAMPLDPIWGHHGTMRYAWAGDPEVRFEAATGGALTALGIHLLDSRQAEFVLHVGADPGHPVRSRSVISETPGDVRANTGSRYGPTAPLTRLGEALERGQPFAVIAKPCDLGAVHRLAASDPRVDEFVVARLAMVCGGQSHLSKSQRLLGELGVAESEVALFRYRGFGNPGPTRVETRDGQVFEKTYLEVWEDEGTWDLETRCKLCPDALGEATDVAAADVWPSGSPVGEDEGFNGIIVRSDGGETLVADAARAGHLVLGDPIGPREFDEMQPHQVRKKVALAARYRGMQDAGIPPIVANGLRVEQLGELLSDGEAESQREGTARRMRR